MGSLCCVAARPHGTSSTSREWPLTPTEPFWCTNASFSLTPSDQFYRHPSFPSHGYQSSFGGMSVNSASSNSLGSSSQGSESWERSGIVTVDSGLDGVASNFSSPDNGFENWQELSVNNEDFVGVPAPRSSVFTSFFEETSIHGTSDTSPISSRSVPSAAGGEYKFVAKRPQFAPRSLPMAAARRSFISKPVHPLSFPEEDSLSLSSSPSSVTESPDTTTESLEKPTRGPQCGVCRRVLTRRSPWGPRKIVHTSDMPVVSILSCSHVYHAECLDIAASKMFKHDPVCPVCDKFEKDSSDVQQWASTCRLKNGFPKLRSAGEGSSRVWSCAGAGAGGDTGTFRNDLFSRNLLNKENLSGVECFASPANLEGKFERNVILD